jgi:hypothetical protein
MIKKLQLVVLGGVVLQAMGMNASEGNKQNSPKTPRTPRPGLSCSQQARLANSNDFAPITGLKRSLEVRKEERNNTSYAYYPWPGANPDFSAQSSIVEQMKPWFPHH